MKKFLFQLVLYSLPVFAFAVIIELLIRNIPNDYSYKRKHLEKHANEIEVLFLGSSHAYYGINPEFILKRSFNASHISQSIDYDWAILNKYAHNWDNLKFIVVPIDYGTLFGRLSLGIEFWRVKNYEIYYNIHQSVDPLHHSELLSFPLRYNRIRLFDYYFDNKTQVTCSTLGYGIDERKTSDMDQTGLAAAKRHTKSDLSLLQDNLSIIEKMIEFAENKNVKIIFYTSPAYKTYVSNLSKEQLDLTTKHAYKIADYHKNCYYYNFLEDTAFKISDFRDADHLNQNGARKLSKKLNEKLLDIDYKNGQNF